MRHLAIELFVSEQAIQDIEAISTWYESRGALRAASDVARDIFLAIEDIHLYPEASPVGLSGARERVLSNLPYRIAYVFDSASGRAVIHAVVHTRRQWPPDSH